MRINQLNNRHYDTRKFDECPNFYAILANEKIIEINREKDQDTIENIHVTYNIFETLLVYTNDMSKLTDHQNGYKIVYGHFYNETNEFLFKKVENGKIVGYNIHRCQKSELWRNKLDQLYISNYFGEVKRTAQLLNTKLNEEVRKDLHPTAITYTVENNTLDFGMDFLESMSAIYNMQNELLQLNAISNKIKIS